jgi:repressor LexA
MNPTTEGIGTRVKKRRVIMGLSQKKLSDLLGVAQAHISKIERGKGYPSPKLLVNIARVLKTTSGYLTGSFSESESSPFETGLVEFDRETQRYKVRVIGRISAGGTENCSIAAEEVIAVIESDKPMDYALLVRGDSMEPRLFDGDVVLIQKTPVSELKNRDMVVVIRNFEEGLVKRFFQDDSGNVILQSDNANYPPLIIPADQIGIECFIVGKVIEIRAYPGSRF